MLDERIQFGADCQLHSRIHIGYLLELYPQIQRHGRLLRGELDGLVRFALYDLEGYFTYGIDSEATRVAVNLLVFYFILGDAVFHSFQIGKVRQHSKDTVLVLWDSFYLTNKFSHLMRLSVCY